MADEFLNGFISYGRIDSKEFAFQLHHRLTQHNLKIWFDQNDIPLAVDFQDQIDHGIERSDNFLFLISPHSINSIYCYREIEHALKCNKRIIPILHVEQISRETWQQRHPGSSDANWEDYQDKGLHSSFPNMHPEIARINWVYFREGIDDFEASFLGLLEIFGRHQDYVQQHTRLFVKALEWEQHQKQSHYLLVGEDCQQAERWLKTRFKPGDWPCLPLDLQCELIIESIKNANNLMTQVFLAYAEEDQVIANQICRRLMREGFTTWLNSTDIQTGTVLQQSIDTGIEEADNVIYLLSPASLQSETCQSTLDYALSLNKRIISIHVKGVDFSQVPPTLKHLQPIDLTDNIVDADYQKDESQLIKILRQDASYYEEHKVLLTRSLKWNRQNHNPSILLRGYNLQHAEAWLKVAKQNLQHPPTPLQEAFISESLRQPLEDVQDVFISYSRTDSGFARKLNNALQLQGKKTWFDQESIASGTDFQQEIYRGIEGSDNFLFILSPSSVNSPYCADEVEYAAKLNKRFVTVLHRAVNPAELHSELARIQWIDFAQPQGGFSSSFSQLIRTLDTDRDHLHAHTKWSQRAIEWANKKHNEDLLLRGSELAIATAWLQEAKQTQKQPPPTELQVALIVASDNHRNLLLQLEEARKNRELKLARRLVRGAFVALTAVTGLAVFAGIQWVKAEKGQIAALNKTSEAHFALNRNSFDALVEGLNAAKRLKELPWGTHDAQLRTNTVTNLAQALNWVTERNRLQGHSDALSSVAFSPDAQTIATASFDQTVKLWSRTGALLNTLQGHEGGVTDVVFSPDGKLLATAGNDKTAKLWSPDGTLLQTLTGHTDWITSVAFSPDSQTIATSSGDTSVKLWDRNGQLLQTLTGHTALVGKVTFSPEGSAIATADDNGVIKLWNQAGQLLQELKANDQAVYDIAFSPDRQIIASAHRDNSIRLWSRETGDVIHTLTGHSDRVWSVSFSPDGQTIATASQDTTVRLWDRQGKEINRLEGHGGAVYDASFSPDGQLLASASRDLQVKLWQLGHTSLTTLRGHDSWVHSAKFSPSGDLIATAGLDGIVKLWNRQGQEIRQFLGHDDLIKNLSFSPDGKTIATAGNDGTAKLWSVEGVLLHNLSGHTNGVNQVSFSPDGKVLATVGGDDTVRIWDLNGQEIQALKGHGEIVNGVNFSPDGQLIVTAGSDQTVKLWSSQGKEIRTFQGHLAAVNRAVFSPDGQTIATASQDGNVKLWTLDGQNLVSLNGHTGGVLSVSFSPDNETIATASADKTIKLWNKNGSLIVTLTGHTSEVNSIEFSPDGKEIASASDDGSVIVWQISNLTLDNLMNSGCRWLQAYLITHPDRLSGLCTNANVSRN